MRLNQKVKYGVACLCELAKHLSEYVDAEAMARTQNIPPAYAHKVLQAMAHAGLVYAMKGAGYKLARPLSDITALEVIEALTKDADPNASNPDMGELLERRINQTLGNMTLNDLKAMS
jgi:Rrf2 family protein